MEKLGDPINACINWRVLVLLSALILLVYSNSFNASWHFDDFQNITDNKALRLTNLHPETLYHATFESKDNERIFYRPAAYLSFALNWYYGKTDVTGYHVVNTAVHILTAFFLFLAILALFKTPNLAGKYSDSEYFIAILAAVLWAANPIQTQAVTYIVQRMAAMAALFYVLGIYLYIKARTSVSWKNRLIFYAGVILSFLLAVGSKENALMFPSALFLVEIIFFQNLSNSKTRRRFIWLGCALAAALFILGVLLFMDAGFIARLQSKYETRTFSLFERVLTQPRIVVFYLSQIFYPIPDLLSIVHDIEVSKSLFQPWQTLPAILFLLGLAAAGIWKIKRHPLFSFAVLFFLLNHIIESTIIPLELVFEHRNYLPSLFLFLPIAAGLKWAIDYYYAGDKKTMAVLITGFVTLLIMALGTGTYVRNMAWATEYTLWKDALEKAPNSARPYHNLSAGYYTDIGNYEKVIELCTSAIDLNEDSKHKAEILALENIANAYAKGRKNYEKVISIYKRVLSLAPKRYKTHYHLILALIHTEQLDKAQQRLTWLISEDAERVKYLTVNALINLQKDEPEKAIPYLVKAIQKEPDDVKAGISIGLAKSMIGKYRAAAHYLDRIPENASDKNMALLLLIENSVRAGNLKEAEEYAEKLVAKVNPEIIREKLKEANEPGLVWPVSTGLVAPVIADVLKKQSMNISELPNADEEKARS